MDYYGKRIAIGTRFATEEDTIALGCGNDKAAKGLSRQPCAGYENRAERKWTE